MASEMERRGRNVRVLSTSEVFCLQEPRPKNQGERLLNLMC
jgi:hypothetical protein